jgi:YesN/AraC family two-component response regulator
MTSAQAMKKRYQILLIDTDAGDYCQGLVTTLRNCHVIVNKNSQKACEFFFRNNVDLVLLNHTPDDPCTDLLQVLRFVAPSVPVIIMTAWGSEEFAVTVFRNGASDYLKKPLNIDELENSIEAALGRKNGLYRELFNQSTDGINKAIHYINGNYCLPLKLTHVAREVGMSVSCLERAFKKKLGVTFSMYLHKVRICRAIQMLEEGIGFSIGEIALACGFTNQYHFTRLFKKMIQTCPRDFKKALIENRLYNN